jgi:hypothetical protein
MISPEEIKEQATKWWKPFLQSVINNEPFFPKQIDRIGKIRSGHITAHFEVLKNEVDVLYQYSKNETGIGYWVQTVDKHFRRTGAHQLPECIVFESAEDYLHVTCKTKEWKTFQGNLTLILGTITQLKDWVLANPVSLTSTTTNWKDLLKVCNYFIQNPRPQLYIRQLPIAIHTKFIEENSSLIQSLLDYLIPDHIRDAGQKEIARRYFLKHDEPLIRIRILDSLLAPFKNITDVSLQLSDFECNNWPVDTVFITENKMNFLTLPPRPSAVAIWSGGGFKVSYLKQAHWLSQKRIYYWGDIDPHGFQILHQIRSYFSQTQSLMMEAATFESFQEFTVTGEKNIAENLSQLNKEEAELYKLLRSKEAKNRLEQEKIPQHYAERQFEKIKEQKQYENIGGRH